MKVANFSKNLKSEKKILGKKFFEVFDLFDDVSKSKYIRRPLSEYDILDLQEKFLNNGMHHITVDNVDFGRELIFKFANSMRCYHDNAVLSAWSDLACSISNEEITFTDVYYELMENGYLDMRQNFKFNDFFIDKFFYEFLFIEASQELIESKWFVKFFSCIKNFEIDKHMPILIVSYSR